MRLPSSQSSTTVFRPDRILNTPRSLPSPFPPALPSHLCSAGLAFSRLQGSNAPYDGTTVILSFSLQFPLAQSALGVWATLLVVESWFIRTFHSLRGLLEPYVPLAVY